MDKGGQGYDVMKGASDKFKGILSIIRGENCAPHHTLSRTDLIDKPCRVW
jgi:hypothetical protein